MTSVRRRIPDLLARSAVRWRFEPWLETLTGRIAQCERALGVRCGEPFDPGGDCAWVAPVGEHAVLKVTFPHPEADGEGDALAHWDGAGAVRLLGRVDEHNALLLERCTPGTRLCEHDGDEVFRASVDVLHALWSTPPPAAFRTLADELHRRAQALREAPFDHGGAADVFAELSCSPEHVVLVHGDLHPANVLAARRAPWLAIDPKPYCGDAAFDTAAWLLNLGDALTIAAADAFASALGVGRARVRAYLWARMVEEALWCLPIDGGASDGWLRRARQFEPS